MEQADGVVGDKIATVLIQRCYFCSYANCCCYSICWQSCGHWPVELYNIIELVRQEKACSRTLTFPSQMVLGDDEVEKLKSFRSSALVGQERGHEERWPTFAFGDRLRDRRSIVIVLYYLIS